MPFDQGYGLSLLHVADLHHVAELVFRHLPPGLEKVIQVEGIPRIGVGEIAVVGMAGDVILVREEWPHAPELEDALAAIQHGQLVNVHERFPGLLVVEAVGGLPPPALTGVIEVNGLLAQRSVQVLEGGGLRAAQEERGITIAQNGVGIVLVDGFELALSLQDQAGGDLPAANRGNELFKVWNLPDVGELVQEAPYMDGQPSSVLVICLFTQEIEKLGVDQGDQEVEGAVGVRHDEEQRRLPVSQRVQLQLVVGRDVPQFLDVKGRQSGTAGNQDGFGGLS